jgi:hypothetical protein
MRGSSKDEGARDHEVMETVCALSALYSFTRCSDRRDMVYALLSLEHPERNKPTITVDYTISMIDLFITTLLHRIGVTGMLGRGDLVQPIQATQMLIEGLHLTLSELNHVTGVLLEKLAHQVTQPESPWLGIAYCFMRAMSRLFGHDDWRPGPHFDWIGAHGPCTLEGVLVGLETVQRFIAQNEPAETVSTWMLRIQQSLRSHQEIELGI